MTNQIQLRNKNQNLCSCCSIFNFVCRALSVIDPDYPFVILKPFLVGLLPLSHCVVFFDLQLQNNADPHFCNPQNLLKIHVQIPNIL